MPHNDSLPGVSSYSSAMSACEKGEQWQHALGPLVEMRHKALLPYVISYKSGISVFIKFGQWQHALELLVRMLHNDSLPDVISYSCAISACGKVEQWQHALGLLVEMQQNGLLSDVVSYNSALLCIFARRHVKVKTVHYVFSSCAFIFPTRVIAKKDKLILRQLKRARIACQVHFYINLTQDQLAFTMSRPATVHAEMRAQRFWPKAQASS